MEHSVKLSPRDWLTLLELRLAILQRRVHRRFLLMTSQSRGKSMRCTNQSRALKNRTGRTGRKP